MNKPYTKYEGLLLYSLTVNNIIQFTLYSEIFDKDMLKQIISVFTNINDIDKPIISDAENHSELSILNAILDFTEIDYQLTEVSNESANGFINHLISLNTKEIKTKLTKKYHIDFSDMDYSEFKLYI